MRIKLAGNKIQGPIFARTHRVANVAILTFALALVLRLAVLALSTHDPQTTADSAIYIGIGHGIAETGDYVRRYADYYEPVTERVPVYPAFLALFFHVFGDDLTLPLIFQCLLDSLTCVIIALIGREINERLFLLSGILAAVNLNMAVHATLILTDTVFLFLLSGLIFALFRHATEPHVKWVALAGIALSLAVLTRPLFYYFLPVFLLMTIAIPLSRRRSTKAIATGCGVAALVVSMLVGPMLIRNYMHYGYFQLVSQGGAGAMEWYVPLTFQYAVGEGPDAVISRQKERLNRVLESQPDQDLANNPFFVSDAQVKVAREELAKLKAYQIAYAWVGGALLNIFTPSLSSLPALVQMERPRFFETEGSGFVNKTFNFLTHPDNRLYLFMVVPAILLTLVSRGLAVVGLVSYAFRREASKIPLVVLLTIALYFLAITGPLVSAARYRLPIEPILIVFLALGLVSLYDRWFARRGSPQLSSGEIKS